MTACSASPLSESQHNLADMLCYAVIDCGFDPDEFFARFIATGIADQFGNCNPKYVLGMSGVELAREVLSRFSGASKFPESTAPYERDDLFWAGWILAAYQIHTALRYTDLRSCGLTIKKVRSMYILHEADPQRFFDAADEIIRAHCRSAPARLRTVRKSRGLTQKLLSEISGVGLRAIQLYEQKERDINCSHAVHIVRLAEALSCSPRDILEIDVPAR